MSEHDSIAKTTGPEVVGPFNLLGHPLQPRQMATEPRAVSGRKLGLRILLFVAVGPLVGYTVFFISFFNWIISPRYDGFLPHLMTFVEVSPFGYAFGALPALLSGASMPTRGWGRISAWLAGSTGASFVFTGIGFAHWWPGLAVAAAGLFAAAVCRVISNKLGLTETAVDAAN